MKSILFVINTFSDIGGHYYSLVTTATALSMQYRVYIVNVGEKPAPIISNTDIPHSYVYSDLKNQGSVTRQITRIVKSQHAEVIHAFDQVSYFLSFFTAWRCGIPLVATKCGGPVSPNYPYINNIVVFTKEDQTFFNSKLNCNESQIALIPNRVIPFQQDKDRIDSLRKVCNIEDKRVILRIGRIDPFYYETSKQSINLAKALHELDPSFVLLIVGNVVDNETLGKMRQDAYGCDFIYFVTDRKFTLDAKQLIDIAEIVVGTGRGFMEACSLGKTMMAPNKGNLYPTMMTDDIFDEVFYYNFSERYKGRDYSPTEIIEMINHSKGESLSWFDHYFSSSKIEPLYSSFYDNLKPTKYYKIFKDIVKPLLSGWYHTIKLRNR
ncbi:MAG: hypothetical protein J6S89_08285 [Paludibacteraceae bacterium]|nr:hypothetical protein [Paludibacteraceae bacterium]MBP5664511.1 hypothetical protein [Bacteroidales bacterium]